VINECEEKHYFNKNRIIFINKVIEIINSFTSHKDAVLAQLVERVAFNHVVVGSIPTDGGNYSSFYLFCA
jgi:hypothetical protein